MVLVDGTVPVPPTRVRQIPPDAPLEEALASWKRSGIALLLLLSLASTRVTDRAVRETADLRIITITIISYSV